MSNLSPVISVRVNATERNLLESAADLARTNLSDFVRRRALEAAEIDILNTAKITIPAADWEKFEAWVNAPPRDIPALKALVATRPIWQD